MIFAGEGVPMTGKKGSKVKMSSSSSLNTGAVASNKEIRSDEEKSVASISCEVERSKD